MARGVAGMVAGGATAHGYDSRHGRRGISTAFEFRL